MKTPLNYYKLLGITSSATGDEVRSAFRSKILQFHHDKTPGEPNDICYELIEAYRILSNRNTRMNYDVQRDKETQHLTDAELIEKYKNQVPRSAENELQVTPEILSELRNAHSRQRQEANQEFKPAGAICYNVNNLLSTKFKSDIEKWRTEFSADHLRDNFFTAYQEIIEETQGQDSPSESFWCDLCRQSFLSETHHSQTVLMPYLSQFGLVNSHNKTISDGITPILQYFYQNVGELFFWEPEPLPDIPEIWECSEWKSLSAACKEVAGFVWELPNPEHFPNVEQHVAYVQKCTWANAGIVRWICWVLANSEMESLSSKSQELLEENALGELMMYIGVLKEFLGFDSYDWSELRQASLEAGEFNMTLLWTMVMVELGIVSPEEWVNYPINSRMYQDESSRSVSQIYFRLGMNSSAAGVAGDSISEHFIKSNDHLSAAAYYIQFDSLSSVYTKYSEYRYIEPSVAKIYRTVYYSQKLKSILPTLLLAEEWNKSSGLEEAIEISQLLLEDPLPAFRLLVQLFPKRLAEPEFYPMHIRNIEGLSASMPEMTFNSLRLILAAWHFIGGENEVDEDFLQFNSSQLMKLKLRESLNSYDFETLTRVLAELNLRNVAAAEETLEELQQQNQDLLSNPSRAMTLMISGSIHKTYRNWLGAISDYQEALLNTPELNYRLTPCISQLSQDFDLHRGILDTVTKKLMEMNSNFKCGVYVDFSQEDLTASNSLVISHPTPVHEFKYSDMAGKMQSEEPKPMNTEDTGESSTQLLPPANTPSVTLEKCERAIELGEDKPLGTVDAAFAYLDLSESLPMHMRHGPTVMAASHFLRAMESAKDLNSAFAYRNSIVELAHRLLQLDKSSQARVQSCLTHKQMFSILLLANQCLSRWAQEHEREPLSESCLIKEESEKRWEEVGSAAEAGNFSLTNDYRELISNSDRAVIEKLLKSVVGFTKVEPLLNIPSLTSSDLGYVEKVKTQFLHHFCVEKVRHHAELSPSLDHAYTLFLEVLHGRTSAISFETSKRLLMDSILRSKKMKMENIIQFIDWSVLSGSNEEGWARWTESSHSNSLQFHPQLQTFESIEGFKINLASGEISFLLSKGQTVFTQQDMFEIFQNGIVSSSLKVSAPEDSGITPNPFKCVNYEPSRLAGTNYLNTMIRISRLLMTLTTGMEVNSNPPFLTREVEISLLDRLPDHLQYFLRPLRERKLTVLDNKEDDDSHHSFSLALTDSYYEENEDSEELVFTLGDAEVALTCIEDTKGPISMDSNHNQEFSPSQSFVQDFNNNFMELGKYFPEFRRLRELGKISAICSKLLQILKAGTYSPQVVNGIKALGINFEEEEYDSIGMGPEDAEYNFIPSPSCHSHPHVIDAIASVLINPNLIYGPVSPSHGTTAVTFQELLEEPKEALETEDSDDIMYTVSATVTVYLRKEFMMDASPVLLQNDVTAETNCSKSGMILNRNDSYSSSIFLISFYRQHSRRRRHFKTAAARRRGVH